MLYELNRLNPKGIKRLMELKNAYDELEGKIFEQINGTTRTLSIALTHLETSFLFSKQSIEQDPDNIKEFIIDK